MFYCKTHEQLWGVFLEQKTEAAGVCFSGARKGGVLWAFSGAEKSAAGFLLESSFSAAEERQSCSCAVWFLCRKNKLQQQVFYTA